MSTSASARAPRAKASGGNWLVRRWRSLPPRGRRVFAIAVVSLFVAVVALVGTAYATAKVPKPSDLDNKQATVILYRDGSVLGQIAKENRTDVPLADVPPHVRDAVLAAEDRGYYKHSGISVTGIARAAFQDVFGHGAKQGGSTITQQYARNKFLSQHRTFARKFRESIIAVKLDRKYSKDQVLEWYLNTIYFGRGAYGVEAASQTYFGVHAKQLTVEQGAVLAALIRSPEGGDPAIAPNTAHRRWQAVLDGMVEMKRLPKEKAAGAKYPAIRDRRARAGSAGNGTGAGPTGYIIEAVRNELRSHGFGNAEIDSGGLRVTTTLDRKRQDNAVKAVTGVLDDPAKDPHAALVAIQPGTGQVVAMYGGRDYGGKGEKSYINYALNERQPGSSFKPFVLAAALDDGISLKSTWDGHSPQTFANYPVHNFGDEQFGRIDLVQATAHSVNTVYVPLGMKVGFDKTMETAHRLGIPDGVTCNDHKDATIYLGTCEIAPVDEAASFATFAAKGKAAGWHLVTEVKDRKGHRAYAAKVERREALSEGEAADAIYAMRAVVEQGTARSAALGRPAAGKTGTTSDNTNAWFSGFVPQLAATVWMGYEPKPGSGIAPLKNLHGYYEVTGGTLPAKIWHEFMAAALEGVPVEDFPPPVFGGHAVNPAPSTSATPTPSATATPTATPSATPTAEVTVTVEPTVVPTLETKSPKPTKTETTTAPPPSDSPTPAPASQAPASGAPPG
ncbi:MAG TPA: transglycosylase domain-containing protein [Mycobacteriales bacterium]|nr:transglycosylase domain-containing protein [Mycobacteriales bacterium]